MPLTPGTRLGAYEITAAIGAGGMGEVYRARDLKLNRDVALKVLPAAVGQDPDRLARFRREAQVLAALNHPNIAHIHGFEDTGETHALVMELVPGPTLAERLAGGPLQLPEALAIAKQIADAMEAAHEQGIIHRDLKPANIKLKGDWGPTPTRLSDGRLEPTLSATDVTGCTVKVLDFGLAKAVGPDSSGVISGDSSNSPTLTARATQLGVIIGTAAYMSPEQAKGRPVDRRADIWAFGVILYEMISGKRGYEAEDISETLAAVLTREVDWQSLPSDTPAQLKGLIRDCLVRDPKQRLRDIGDARRTIERLMEGAPADASPGAAAAGTAATPKAKGRALPWLVAAAAVLIGGISTALALRPAPPPPRVVTRTETQLKDFSALIAISSDSTKLAYVVAGGQNVTLPRASDARSVRRKSHSRIRKWRVAALLTRWAVDRVQRNQRHQDPEAAAHWRNVDDDWRGRFRAGRQLGLRRSHRVRRLEGIDADSGRRRHGDAPHEDRRVEGNVAHPAAVPAGRAPGVVHRSHEGRRPPVCRARSGER